MTSSPYRRLRHVLLGGAPLLFAAAHAQNVETVAVKAKTVAQQAAAKTTPVTVISAQKISDNNAFTVESIAQQTPSLYIPVGPSNSSSWNFIRGIGEPDPQGDQTVGVYIDGIALPRSLGSNEQLLDVAAVEVDRGPTGFDGGRNSEGGAVRVTTETPSNQRHIAAEGGYGSLNEQLEGVLVSGAIIPDLLYGSITAEHHQRDGNVKQINTGLLENNINDSSARAKLRYTPTDYIDVTLAVDGSNDSGTARAYSNVLFNQTGVSDNPLFPKSSVDQGGATLTGKYALNDNNNLTSITGWHQFAAHTLYDNNADAYARITQPLIYRDKTFSQEFRLNGNSGKFDYATGFYADYEDWYTDRWANTPTGYYAPAYAYETTYLPTHPVIHQLNNAVEWFDEDHYQATDRLKLTAGVILKYEYHASGETLGALSNGPIGLAQDLTVIQGNNVGQYWSTNGNNGHAFHSALPEFKAEYKLSDNLLPYFRYARGEKQGGYDFRSQVGGSAAANLAGLIQATHVYKPEYDTSFELGLNSNWFGGRLIAKGDIYYQNLDDYQNTTTDPTTNTSHRYNIGNGHSDGVELDVHAQITPVWDADITGSAGNAVLTHFVGTAVPHTYGNGLTIWTTPRSGAWLPYAPKFQGDISTSYILPVPASITPGQWRLWGNADLQSSHYSDITDLPEQKIEGTAIFDTALGYTTADGRLNLKLTIKNLLDKHYWTALSFTAASLPAAASGQTALLSGVRNDSRSAFFSVKYTY